MRPDELTQEETLAASIAVARHRKEFIVKTNGTPATDAATPTTALVQTIRSGSNSHNRSVTPLLEPNSLIELQQLGALMAQSGFFSDARQAAQACVKILAGREMGFPPIASMVGISIIEGKPAAGANLLAAAMKRAGYTWRVVQRDTKGCKLVLSFKGQEIGPSEFTEDDARRANLLGKRNWQQYPRSMYFARCISDAARTYAPEALAGLPAYTAEELGAEESTEDGALIPPPAPEPVYEPEPTEQPIDIGPHRMNTRDAAAYVRDRKLEELREAALGKPWKTKGEFYALLALLRERIGEVRFAEEMAIHGKLIHELTSKEALIFYRRLVSIAEQSND
jgi:hypothetical protein